MAESGDNGVVDVSPDECLNSTDDTNLSFGGCIFHEFGCCNDIECVKCGTVVAVEMLPNDEPPMTNVDEPFPAFCGFTVIGSELWPSLIISLLVAVELLDNDSFRGGCNVCWVNCEHRVAIGRDSM